MAEIIMQPLTSSNLSAAGYDAETHTLRVEFKSGSTYSYANVPPEIAEGLLSAPSAGQYFAKWIKSGYSFVRED